MAEFPALPLFTDAYLADTRHLNAAQHGAYLLLLMMAWRTPDCSLPNDDVVLARWASMDKRTWTNNKDTIMSFWKLGDDQKYRQLRLVDERKYVEQKRNKNSENGKASALKRKARGSTIVQLSLSQNSTPTLTPTPDISKDISIPPISPNKTEASMHFESIWNAYPGRGKDGMTGAGFKGDKKTARLKFETIYKKTKEADRENLIRSIIDGCAKYRQFLERTDYPSKHLSTWLNAAGWETDYGVSATAQANARRGGESRIQAAHDLAMADQTYRHLRERGGNQGSGMGVDPSNIRGGDDTADAIDVTLPSV